MLVIDEYLAVRVLGGNWPDGLPDDDDLVLPASRHWRLLQRIHNPSGGQLSELIGSLPSTDRNVVRFPHPELLQILDPRPLLDTAAQLTATYRAGGWLIAETLAAGLTHGHQLWFGLERNVGPTLAGIADELGAAVHVLEG